MFRQLKILSTRRSTWAFIALSALLFEGAALFFQYGLNLPPCVMCVYERLALFGVVFAGLIGLINPQFWLWRFLGLLFGASVMLKGFFIALQHVDYQLNPGPWNQCSLIANFPPSLPLDQWLPVLFHPTGSCNDIVWQFLGFSMAQWIVVLFGAYFMLFLLLFLSQFVRSHRNRMLFMKNK